MATNATATKKANTSTTKTTTQPAEENRAVSYVIQTAERSVDVPVGVALTVRDRVSEAVEPWTTSTTREKELKSLRTQVTREFNKFERRGGQARRKASQRVRQTRNRLEREVKQRRRSIEKQVKGNRAKVEKAVKDNRTKAEKQLKKAQSVVQERVTTGSTAS
jgi:hypothetical protein